MKKVPFVCKRLKVDVGELFVLTDDPCVVYKITDIGTFETVPSSVPLSSYYFLMAVNKGYKSITKVYKVNDDEFYFVCSINSENKKLKLIKLWNGKGILYDSENPSEFGIIILPHNVFDSVKFGETLRLYDMLYGEYIMKG